MMKMKKRILTVLFALILCVSAVIPALAKAGEAAYIIDGFGLLSDEELDALNTYGAQLADVTDTGILFVFAFTEDLSDYVSQAILDKGDDLILMIETDEYWDMYLYGAAEDLLSEDDVDDLRAAYVEGTDYCDSIAAYMYAAAQLLAPHAAPRFGAEDTTVRDPEARVVDMAALLSDSEKSALLSKLDEISERQQADIVVVTAETLDGKTPMEYADDFYDDNGYGFGEDRDGVLLLVSMEDRDWWMSTTGFGITAITDAGIEYISDKFLSDLSDGDYAEAFTTYADLCDTFFTQAKTGEPYDAGHMPKEPFNVVQSLLIAFVIGLVIALIVTNSMKNKLKTVRFQAAASDYVRKDSMHVTDGNDLFLYTQLHRYERATDDDSSGGSSTHTSSSGTTHGGGGGKF